MGFVIKFRAKAIALCGYKEMGIQVRALPVAGGAWRIKHKEMGNVGGQDGKRKGMGNVGGEDGKRKERGYISDRY